MANDWATAYSPAWIIFKIWIYILRALNFLKTSINSSLKNPDMVLLTTVPTAEHPPLLVDLT